MVAASRRSPAQLGALAVQSVEKKKNQQTFRRLGQSFTPDWAKRQPCNRRSINGFNLVSVQKKA